MRKVNGQQMPGDGKSSHCLWQGELKNNQSYFSNHVKGVYNKKNNQSYFSNHVKGIYNKKKINHIFLTMSKESTIKKKHSFILF